MTIKCEVVSVNRLAQHTWRVQLKPEYAMSFKAGQYVMAIMGEKDARAFSIVNGPERDNGQLFELHIGAAEENPYALAVVNKAQAAMENEETVFEIEGPFGEAYLANTAATPRLLIAGGTGFSYIHSILEACLHADVTSPLFLYWGGRDLSQLYYHEEMQVLAAQYPNLTYIPVVDEPSSEWQGKVGNVLEAVMADFVSLASYDIYIAGRFEMAGAARELLCQERGADRSRLFSDAFSFI